MTEKRFTYMEQFNGFCDVYDNGKVLSCMRLEYVDKTVDLLNEQHETIQCHKERIAILSELLDFADAIIDLSDNEKAKNTWANKNTDLNLEWKKVLLKYGVELE